MSWVAVGATVVGGVAAYANKPDKVKPGQQNIGQDIQNYIGGYRQGLPSVLNMEKNYRGKFQNLNLNEISNFLSGGGQNLFGLSQDANKAAAGQLQRSRDQDLRGMRGDTQLARGILNKLSPEQAAQVKAATANAEQLRESAKGLSGQEQRTAEQFAREQGLDSGRIGDNSTIASGLLNRENILAGKRQEANAASDQAYGMAGDFYTQNGMNLLTQMPQSYQAGQGLLGIGLGSIGSATPQLVNPDMGINVGAANKQNQLAASSANAQAAAAQNAAYMNLLGQGFSSYMKYR